MNKNEKSGIEQKDAETGSTSTETAVATTATKASKKEKKSAKAETNTKKLKEEKSGKAPRAGKKPVRKENKKPAAKAAAKTAASKKNRTADNSNRNFGRIKVLGMELPKGRAVLAVVKDYAAKKKATAAQLKEAFPDELLRTYGIVKDAASAKKVSSSKKRFFIDQDDLIKTKDGKTLAVCAGFSTENIKPFIKHAKTFGYNMVMASK